MSDSTATQDTPNRVAGILGTATILALLYFGREVLIPITLAVILSLLIAPLVHRLRRIGVGQTLSIGIAVLALAFLLASVGTVIGSQVVRLGTSLPQYADTIRSKISTLDQLTLGKIGAISGQANRVLQRFSEDHDKNDEGATASSASGRGGSPAPIPVEIRTPPLRPIQLLTQIVSSVWAPLETAGIVFVVLFFVLMEHEALRDRLIRIAGGNDLRATTVAVNDAGERLSRFFISQFAVNIAVGALLWLGLSAIGLAQALLWGAMATVLRFIPYVGIWIAAFCATLLAAAVVPGWSLAIMTIGLFLIVELVFGQLVEPKLYGHTTGLSPLSVVIAAIFWSWIWGPVGLVVSTPLTLCLVVAGRYFPALNILEILFGEVPALTISQNFYQRALSGDAQEIIRSARRILKRKSFAAYCDTVLLPALHLARVDLSSGVISEEERRKVADAIVSVIETLGDNRKWWKHYTRNSVLGDVSIGRHLRHRREDLYGKWQGALDVPDGTVVLGIDMGLAGDELAAEILVRILQEQRIDGRHIAQDEFGVNPPSGAKPEIISVICLVSTDPVGERQRIDATLADLKIRLPHAKRLVLILPSPFDHIDLSNGIDADGAEVVYSFEEAALRCLRALPGGDQSS